MGTLIFVFVIELLIAYLAYLLLKRFLPKKSLVSLSIAASIAALVVGWSASYRITANTVIRDFVSTASAEQERKTRVPFSLEQSAELARQLKETPDYFWLVQKGAAVNSLLTLLIVLLIIVPLARKQERTRSTNKLGNTSV